MKEKVEEVVNEIKDVHKSAPGFLGRYAAKVSWAIIKPLDQVHKHVTEPFIDAFMEEFNNSK